MGILFSDWLIAQQILHVLKLHMKITVKLYRNCDKPKEKNWGILVSLSVAIDSYQVSWAAGAWPYAVNNLI